MNTFIRSTVLATASALCAFAASAQTETNGVPESPSFTEAELLLYACIDSLPSESYVFTGDIVMRKAYGVELKRLKFKSTISWDPLAPSAEYEIYSDKNVLLETLRAERRGTVQTLTRTVGADRKPAPAPKLNEPIQGTDVTWLDAMMDFVWWENPVSFGSARIKGRNSEILKVFPSEPIPGCAAVYVWIDTEQLSVLQATQEDGNGKVTRKMWVDSVQKIDDQWVVKDIEVETGGTGRRTKIHVDDVKKAAK